MSYQCLFCKNIQGSQCNHRLICARCYANFISTYSWYGCSRCGKNECIDCQEMREFVSVTSLFRLDTTSAKLILAAKDKKNTLAIEILKRLLRTKMKVELAQLFSKFRKPHLLFSPLRAERIFNGYWHPLMLLHQVAKELSLNFTTSVIFNTDRHTFLPRKARAFGSFAANERMKNCLFLFHHEPIETGITDIIFLDDVLTSGSSALRAYHHANPKFPKANWHVLTLFRTPVAQNTLSSKKKRFFDIIPS